MEKITSSLIFTMFTVYPGKIHSQPVGEHAFQMLDFDSVVRVNFGISEDKRKVMLVQIADGDTIRSESYDPPEVTAKPIRSSTGRYYPPELDTHYSIYAKGDSTLMGNHTRQGDFEIRINREDDLEAELEAFKGIRVKRDKKKKILGLYVSNGRVRNFWFEKL